jgi:hypothetical protein
MSGLVWFTLVWSGLVGELQRWRHVGAGLIHLLTSLLLLLLLLTLCAEQDELQTNTGDETRVCLNSFYPALPFLAIPHLCLVLPCPARPRISCHLRRHTPRPSIGR